MVFETAHNKILEYLNKFGSANTFRLSRHLKIDRIGLINLVEELKHENLVEFKYGVVSEIRALQEVSTDVESNDTILKAIKKGIQQKRKGQKIQKDIALKILGDVNPAYNFYLCDGTIIKNLDELLRVFENIVDEAYFYHASSENNDFSNWIREVIGDAELADSMRIRNREEAIEVLKDRIDYLKTRLK